MAFDAFVAYETVGRKVRSLKPSQAEVDAVVAVSADDLTAYVGTVSVPDAAFPGWYFDPANQTFAAEAPSEAIQYVAWKQLLSRKAVMVDEAIKSHWANQTRRQSSWETARTIEDARKLDNTFDWARLWIGLPWLEILKREGDATALALQMYVGPPAVTAALSHAGVEEVVNQGRAELPNYDHIYFWYAAHNDPEDWHRWLDTGQVYTTRADGGGTIWKPARYGGIAEATRQEIVVTYYGAARNYAAGIGV